MTADSKIGEIFPDENFWLCDSYYDFFYYCADSQQNKNCLQPENDECGDGAKTEPQHTSNSSSTLPQVEEMQSEDMIDGVMAGKRTHIWIMVSNTV